MGSILRNLKRKLSKKDKKDIPAMLKKKTGTYTLQCLGCGHHNKNIIINGFGKFARKCEKCGKTMQFERNVDDIDMRGAFFDKLKTLPPKIREHYLKKYNEYLISKSGNANDLARLLNMSINNKTINFLNQKANDGFDIYSKDEEVRKQIQSEMRIAMDVRCPECGCSDYVHYKNLFYFCTGCGLVSDKVILGKEVKEDKGSEV
jgi:uncharacterized protein (DUF983 family)